MPSSSVAAIWKQFGYNLAFYLAGLQAIPDSVLEAASVDGAGPVRRFFSMTSSAAVAGHVLPVHAEHDASPSSRRSGLVHSVTKGGPGDATTILVYKA